MDRKGSLVGNELFIRFKADIPRVEEWVRHIPTVQGANSTSTELWDPLQPDRAPELLSFSQK